MKIFLGKFLFFLIGFSYASNSGIRQTRSAGWLWPSGDSGDGNSDKNLTPPPKAKVEQVKSAKKPSNLGRAAGTASKKSSQPRGAPYWSYSTTSTSTSSTSTDSNSCVCVPFYECDEDQIVEGGGAIDIRWGWPCSSIQEVCCRSPSTTSTVYPYTTKPTQSTYPGFKPKCGTLNPNGINARILGFKDSEAQFGEYPWISAVLEWKYIGGKKVFQFLCGGSLIWPSVIITSAHCVNGKKAERLTVRLGDWDTQTSQEFYPHQNIQGKEIVLHPRFYGGALYYDVALIFLAKSATLAPHIDTVCLPGRSVNYDSTSCWAAGWGKNAFGANGTYQSILKEVELSIVSRNTCQSALRKTNLGSKFNLHDSFLCAGGLKGLDTCVGDGGGPLVCPSTADPWRYVVAGVISWGVGCGTHGVPGVYADVTKVRAWIDQTISSRVSNYDTSRVTVGPNRSG